jgi:hypothetical protein
MVLRHHPTNIAPVKEINGGQSADNPAELPHGDFLYLLVEGNHVEVIEWAMYVYGHRNSLIVRALRSAAASDVKVDLREFRGAKCCWRSWLPSSVN